MAELVAKYQQYEEYKDSGIESTPEIPNHWIAGKVKYVTESLNSVRVPLSSEERGSKKGEYPYYGASGIIDYVDDYLFDEETILFGEDGANLISRSTPLAFLANGKYWVNNHAHILRTKDGVNDYWVMCFENMDVTAFISGSAQPKLTAEALGDLKIVYPPTIAERKEIANFLDHETAQIDTLIEKQQTLIQLLKEKRQAVISHAVTKGLNPDAPMKDSGVEWLGEVPQGWKVATVRRYLLEHRQGYYTSDSYVDDGTKLLRITDLRDLGKIDTNDSPKVPKSASLNNYLLKEGDVVFARTGGAGSFGVIPEVKEDIAYASYLIRFRFLPKFFNTNYLRFMFIADSFQLAVKQNIHGGVNQNIHAEDIKNTFVASPPLDEQEKISTYLDIQTNSYAKLIANAEQAIQLMQERRTALISAAVTGKIDVRGWVAPDSK